MKNIFKATAAIALLLISAPACKEFLEVPPQGQITEEEISKNPKAAEQLVTGVYNVLWLGGFGTDVSGLQFILVSNIASDDADKGSSPTDYADGIAMDNLEPTAATGTVNNIWIGQYQGIARANQALAKIPLSPVDETTKNRYLGEVRFLRAYFYFNLVRIFGGVPKIDTVPPPSETSNPIYQTRATKEEIYELIKSDLSFAADNLPLKGQTQAGRITKGAAQTLLAKVYLYERNYEQVLALTNEVISSGVYTLHTDYNTLWRESTNNNSESIFEIQAGENSNCNAAIEIYVVCQGPRSGGARGWTDLGFGFNNPSQSLVNEYEAGDIRREATIIFIQPSPQGTVLWDGFRVPSQDSVENSRYNYKAYHSRTQERNCGTNDRLPKQPRILRYAEVLLMHAEASIQTGNAGAALNDINLIRTRAQLTPLSSVDLLGIWHERRVELAMENDRYFDLVRQEEVMPGRIVPIYQAHGKTFTKGKNELFPIPQAQIDLSGGLLTQNPMY